ncbi:hypothetical protein CSAL01_13281 [Colletotrichum salicis]|uniref:Uncharacterized protein n=1 Tax=Colletotrichum salicis TaxID=1209931 RepID=A0A135V7Q5_9PEZI|nr:hypothetical protein CSAL01_13281 [Colletotrichum salicis]
MRDRATRYQQGYLMPDGRPFTPPGILQQPPPPPQVRPQAQPFPQANNGGLWEPLPAAAIQPVVVPFPAPPVQFFVDAGRIDLLSTAAFAPVVVNEIWETNLTSVEILQPQVQGFQPMGEIPFMEQRNVHNMDQEARLRQGRGRFSIILYYPDGRNTETPPSVKLSQKPENGAPNAAPPDAALLPSGVWARGGDQEHRGPGPYSRSTPRTRCVTTTCRRRGRWRT